MDEKEFKKHLSDLAHGHHHPEEHDWSSNQVRVAGAATAPKRAKPKAAARKTKSRGK